MVCFFTVPSISQTNYQLTPFNKKGKWGYVNEKEKVVIKAKYQEAGIFISGYAIVKKDNKYGIIDYNNQEAIPLAYDYIIRLDSGIYFTKLKDKYGVVSADGKEIIAPKYDSIERLDSKSFLTKLEDKCGVLSADGKEIIAPKYYSIERLDSKSFLTNLKDKYGVVSADGKEIIAPKYDSIVRLDSKSFLTKLEGKYGILSSNGKEMIPHRYDSIKEVRGNFITKQNDKYGLISSTYTELLPPCLLSLDLDKLKKNNSYQIAKTGFGDSYVIKTSQTSSVTVTNIENLNNDEIFYLLQEEQLSYNDFKKETLSKFIRWLSENTSNPYQIFEAPSFEYHSHKDKDIEIEQNGNIYTYPIVFTCKEDTDNIVFYNTNLSPKDAVWRTEIRGLSYSIHFVTMNKIKIGEQIADIQNCFSPLFENNRIVVIDPKSYIKSPKYPNKLLLTTNVTYAGTPSVIYTQPKWIVLGGQLVEINSGISYDVPLYDVSHLHLINISTMNSELITLEGISDIFMKYDKKGEYIYLMDKSTYRESYRDREHIAISQNQSPIYIASMDNSSNGNLILKTAIIPKKGDVIIDIQRSIDGEYIYLCGSTTKEGYVGYENGILIILKKNNDTYEEIVRYRSKNKDRYYSKIVVLDNENICLKYDNWYCAYQNNGWSPENFDIINIPSITNREQ